MQLKNMLAVCLHVLHDKNGNADDKNNDESRYF